MASAVPPQDLAGDQANGCPAMNPGDPLAELRDIHLPQGVSPWPLAPGWWLLIILTCAVVAGLVVVCSKQYRARLYRRQAMAQLQQIKLSSDVHLVAVLELLKQTVNSAYPEQNYSSLSIDEFITFLKQSCPRNVFENSPTNLESALYSGAVELDVVITEQFIDSAEEWIVKHVPSHKLKYRPLC
jgi:hypothetical protein